MSPSEVTLDQSNLYKSGGELWTRQMIFRVGEGPNVHQPQRFSRGKIR